MCNRIYFFELRFECSVIDGDDLRRGEVQIPENIAFPSKV